MVSTPSRPKRSLGNDSVLDRALTSAPRVSEQRDHRGVVLGRSPHQCRLALLLLARVGVGALVEQPGTAAGVAGAGRRHQHRLAPARRGLGVGAGRQQQLDHLGLPLIAASDSGVMPYRLAALALGAGIEQRAGDVRDRQRARPNAAVSSRQLRSRAPPPGFAGAYAPPRDCRPGSASDRRDSLRPAGEAPTRRRRARFGDRYRMATEVS